MAAQRDPVTAVETERKYEPSPGARLPVLRGLPGVAWESAPDTFTLDADYYDTADLRLLRAGLTLRRRAGGDDEGWHLKRPAGRDTRTEIRLPLTDGPEVPDGLAALVRSYTLGRPLRRQARIRTTRTRRELNGKDGMLAEVVVDQVEATGPDGDRDWIEIEVEQRAGTPELADAIEGTFAEAGIARSRSTSKVARVLGEAHREPEVPGRRASAGELVGGYLRHQIAALAAGDLAVRLAEPDSVHRMRVAARRARSTLRTYATLFASPTRPLGDELRWLGVELGAARDVEVQRERIEHRMGEVLDLIDDGLRDDVDRYFGDLAVQARTRAITALDSPRYLELLRSLETLEMGPAAKRRARKVLPELLADIVSTVDQRVAAAAEDGPDRDELVHRVRKTAKRLRYGVEAARPLAPQAVRSALVTFTALQDLLGECQDAVVAGQHLRELAASACNSFALGVMYQRERDIADARQAGLGRAWRKARRALRPLWT